MLYLISDTILNILIRNLFHIQYWIKSMRKTFLSVALLAVLCANAFATEDRCANVEALIQYACVDNFNPFACGGAKFEAWRTGCPW